MGRTMRVVSIRTELKVRVTSTQGHTAIRDISRTTNTMESGRKNVSFSIFMVNSNRGKRSKAR